MIPESYIVLRMTFRQSLNQHEVVCRIAQNSRDGRKHPCNVMLVDNDGVIIKGSSLEKVFDRLEVLEATANVVLECKSIGNLHLMTESQRDEIDEKWFGEAKTKQAQAEDGKRKAETQDALPTKQSKKASPNYDGYSWWVKKKEIRS